MMDLAPVISKPAPTYPVSPTREDDSLLLLLGEGPFAVDVKIGDTSEAVEFSLDGVTTYPDGLSWQCSKCASQATITFTFVNGSSTITHLSALLGSGLTFAAPSGSKQVCTVPPTRSLGHLFTVNTTGTAHPNAKIVVTPIGDGGGEG